MLLHKNATKQPKTANPNSPWAYIQEGLLSAGFLRMRFRELIFGRGYFYFYSFLLWEEGVGKSLLSKFNSYPRVK